MSLSFDLDTVAPPAPPIKPPITRVKTGGNGDDRQEHKPGADRQEPGADRQEPSPVATILPRSGGALFMARRGESNHWVIWAEGLKGIGITSRELPLPIPCDASIAAAIKYLRERFPQLLSRAWLSYQLGD